LEATAIKLVEQINVLKNADTTKRLEEKAEHEFIREYAAKKREAKAALDLQLDREKQAKYQERGKKDVKHYGRVALFRSEKNRVKKKQKVSEKPQIVKDYETYLGDVA